MQVSSKNLAQLFNKLLKSKCEPAQEYSTPGRRYKGSSSPLTSASPHIPPLGTHKKNCGQDGGPDLKDKRPEQERHKDAARSFSHMEQTF